MQKARFVRCLNGRGLGLDSDRYSEPRAVGRLQVHVRTSSREVSHVPGTEEKTPLRDGRWQTFPLVDHASSRREEDDRKAGELALGRRATTYPRLVAWSRTE